MPKPSSLWRWRYPPSLRIAVSEGLTKEEQTRLRLEELDAADETRLNAQQNLELYRARKERAYNKMARMRTFRKGEWVLVLRRPILGRHMGPKFAPPNGEGPYVIEEVFQGGAYQLINKEGERPCERLVFNFKKYHA